MRHGSADAGAVAAVPAATVSSVVGQAARVVGRVEGLDWAAAALPAD